MLGVSKVRVSSEVVRVVIVAEKTKRLLMVQSHGRMNYWELPGGKVKRFETPEEASLRELFEETKLSGITLTKRHRLDQPIPHDPHIVCRFHFFVGIVTNEPTVIINPGEIIAYKWANIKEAPTERKLDFASRYFLKKVTPTKGRHY